MAPRGGWRLAACRIISGPRRHHLPVHEGARICSGARTPGSGCKARAAGGGREGRTLNSGLQGPHAPFPETFMPRGLCSKELGRGTRSMRSTQLCRASSKPRFLRQTLFPCFWKKEETLTPLTYLCCLAKPPHERLGFGRKQGKLDGGPGSERAAAATPVAEPFQVEPGGKAECR